MFNLLHAVVEKSRDHGWLERGKIRQVAAIQFGIGGSRSVGHARHGHVVFALDVADSSTVATFQDGLAEFDSLATWTATLHNDHGLLLESVLPRK